MLTNEEQEHFDNWMLTSLTEKPTDEAYDLAQEAFEKGLNTRKAISELTQASTGLYSLVKYLQSEDGQLAVKAYMNIAENLAIDDLHSEEMEIVLRLRILFDLLLI